MFFAFIDHLEWFVFDLCFLEFDSAALSVFCGVGPSEEWQAARGYGVKDKELSFVGCQRNVAFASNAFLPVFGVDGDAAVTCWESLVNLDVEFTVFHELFDFGDTCGVALLFLFTHCEKAGKKKYSYWNDCFQRFHVLVVFCKYKCCFNI